MQFSDFKKQTARRNLLARVDTLGSFDFFTTLISLDALSAQDVQQLNRVFQGRTFSQLLAHGGLTTSDYAVAEKVLPLAAHEYTHFLDATSTLWGFRHLGLMNDGYLSSPEYDGIETQFADAKRFFDHCRTIRLPSYYTVVYCDTANVRPWISDTTIGQLFSNDGTLTNKPILFSRFSNCRNEPLARSPVSMVSLLEASAMAQELLLQSALINLLEPNSREAATRRFSEKTIQYLYDPDITEYSVCAHIVANQQKCPDALSAFRLCAIIIRTLLNLPDVVFKQIAENCPVDDLCNVTNNSDFAKAVRKGLRAENLGILFFVICKALPDNSFESDHAAIGGLKEALSTIGVDHEKLLAATESQATEACVQIRDSSINPIRVIARAGYDNFLKLKDSGPAFSFASVSVPPVLLGDSSFAGIFGSEHNLLKDFDFDDCFEQLHSGERWVERFAEACV